jgi:hypothetical protein
MTDSSTDFTTRAPWTPPPTAKAKNSVQRAVTALLNELAPERVVTRAARAEERIEQHRLPNGCVLQASNAALSVSWLPNRDHDHSLGELQIIVWRGTVSQRGATPNPNGATIVDELHLVPETPIGDECVWLAADGTLYTSVALSVKCATMLEEAIVAGG